MTGEYGVASPITYFCGSSPICDTTVTRSNAEKAVSLAKANIERVYMWVGVLEHFETSLVLLEALDPAIFGGISSFYREKMKGNIRNVTPKNYRSSISNATQSILLALLAPDYELYGFVRKRLFDEYRRVFGREPTSLAR